ncbi:MAG: HupE/UreJ family protein [Candidatus Methylomirabilia bacterium]
MRVLGSALVLFVLLFPRARLHAHPANVAYADIVVHAKSVEIDLSVNLFELDLLLSLDQNLNARVEPDELERKRAEIREYLRQRVSVSSSGRELPMETGSSRVTRGADGKALFKITLRFPSETRLQRLAIRCEPLAELGTDHRTIARITSRDRVEQFVFQQGVVYEGRRGVVGYLIQFLRLGIIHIFIGYDHIAFLIGLLLMGGRLLTLVKIVTAFTVAHSLTLSLAAVDMVRLPSRVVEVGIALSIVYIALENFLAKSFDRRWRVSFVFGLLHGFGFASVLREIGLPRSGLVSALFSFNLGVEVGQLVIVVLLTPLLWLLSHTRAHRLATRSVSALILCLGVFWLYQRVW